MAKSVSYYLDRGFDPKMAEYFASGRKQIIKVAPNDDYTLTITFDNGEKRLYNVAHLLQDGTVFTPLRALDIFRRAYVDDTHCIAWDIDPNIDSDKVWGNKVDLSPDVCYVDGIPLGGDAHV